MGEAGPRGAMNDKDRLESALKPLQQAAVHVDTVRRSQRSDYALARTLWRAEQKRRRPAAAAG